jgi:hypothetical protein
MQAVTRFHLRRGVRLDRLIKAKEALLFFARVRRRPQSLCADRWQSLPVLAVKLSDVDLQFLRKVVTPTKYARPRSNY